MYCTFAPGFPCSISYLIYIGLAIKFRCIFLHDFLRALLNMCLHIAFALLYLILLYSFRFYFTALSALNLSLLALSQSSSHHGMGGLFRFVLTRGMLCSAAGIMCFFMISVALLTFGNCCMLIFVNSLYLTQFAFLILNLFTLVEIVLLTANSILIG